MLLELKFSSKHTNGDLLFISMFTSNYLHYATRLAFSLERHCLPFAIYEVPTVHNSISEKGSIDINYTKSSFIRKIINSTGKSIIYIDCDCEVIKFPSLLYKSLHSVDFAIFNWLNSENNNVYLPSTNSEHGKNLFKFSHSIPPTSDSQLICSGAVQMWSNSVKSLELLNTWQKSIESNPGSADDYCLDFSFNNLNEFQLSQLNYYWLPKAYCRYAWWIFDEPVIDHPQIPNTTTKWLEIKDDNNRKRFYANKFNWDNSNKHKNYFFGVIDPYKNTHTILNDSGELNIQPINDKIWINLTLL